MRLEPLPQGFPQIRGLHGRVSWSPDRNRIAFYSGTGAIVVMNADGSNRTSLPYSTGLEFLWGAVPVWSPDGARFTFMYGQDAGFDIYIVDVDGSNLLRISYGSGDEWFPVWSPDGSRVVFFARGQRHLRRRAWDSACRQTRHPLPPELQSGYRLRLIRMEQRCSLSKTPKTARIGLTPLTG